MLWDFFYEKGKDQLAPQTRMILDVFGRSESHNLQLKGKKVLKTILLLQAINEKVGDTVALFIPNKKNLGMAFEGTDLSPSNVVSIADSLISEQIIFERPMGSGQSKYSALVSNTNLEEIAKEKEKIAKDIRTTKLLEEAEFQNDFKLPKYLEVRFYTYILNAENIKLHLARIKSEADNSPNKLFAIYTFARTEEENSKIRSEIKKILEEGFKRAIFIDYSSNYLNTDLLNSYIENVANFNYQIHKDQSQARTYNNNAKDAIRRWKKSVKDGQCRVYSYLNIDGSICSSDSEIFNHVKIFDKEHFPCALETQINVIDNMYQSNALKQGAECGITGEIKGTFKSNNDNTKLEKQFAGVWNIDNYWINKPNELLSKAKIAIEKVIKNGFENGSRISIDDIYSKLCDTPFGFLPCNLTAFVMGFLLKEYANESYNWTDTVTTVPMSVDKMKEMIDEIIKQNQTPSNKHRPKYIVEMSSEQREFNKATAYAFSIDEIYCTSVEDTRTRVRSQMNSFKFPIWTLKYINLSTANEKDTIDKVIDLYVELANNTVSARSETDIAIEIGKLYIENKNLSADLKQLLTKENCTNGMQKYLESYEDGKLIKLAKQIGEAGAYISEISKKFSEASNWVWSKDTVDEKIVETIVEYEIICESNSYITKTLSYADCIKEWIEKTKSFKIAFQTIKNELLVIDKFLEILYHLKKNGYIYESEKIIFLKALQNQKEEFKNFCDNQVGLFKQTMAFNLDGLSNDDISSIASKFYDVFALENSEYQRKVDESVKEYKSNMSKYRLKELWFSKTGTESPLEWSRKYSMPILCIIPPIEQSEAIMVFNVLNNHISDKTKIDEAITYLEKFTHYDKLNSDEARNVFFKKHILKNYAYLLENVENVKQLIKNRLSIIEPYYWLGNIAVEDLLKNIAFQKYNNGGSSKVYQIIDEMSPEELKKYLKNLVKENMTVGIEIMNNKK